MQNTYNQEYYFNLCTIQHIYLPFVMLIGIVLAQLGTNVSYNSASPKISFQGMWRASIGSLVILTRARHGKYYHLAIQLKHALLQDPSSARKVI